MKQFLRKIIDVSSRAPQASAADSGNKISPYKYAKSYRELTITARRLVRDMLLMTAGVFSAAFGFKGFLLTNEFIDGGATGISLLISFLTKVPLYP